MSPPGVRPPTRDPITEEERMTAAAKPLIKAAGRLLADQRTLTETVSVRESPQDPLVIRPQ
jgi:hypothetical protein